MAFKGERPSALQVVGIFAALTGIYMLSGADPAVEPIGVALALAAAVFGGVYFASARLARHYDFASYVFTMYLSAAIVSFVICLAMGVELVGFSLMSWVYIILLAVVPMLFGHTLLNYVLRHTEAFRSPQRSWAKRSGYTARSRFAWSEALAERLRVHARSHSIATFIFNDKFSYPWG